MSKENEKVKLAWLEELKVIRHLGHPEQEEIFDAFIEHELEQPFSQPILWHKLKRLQMLRREMGY